MKINFEWNIIVMKSKIKRGDFSKYCKSDTMETKCLHHLTINK